MNNGETKYTWTPIWVTNTLGLNLDESFDVDTLVKFDFNEYYTTIGYISEEEVIEYFN